MRGETSSNRASRQLAALCRRAGPGRGSSKAKPRLVGGGREWPAAGAAPKLVGSAASESGTRRQSEEPSRSTTEGDAGEGVSLRPIRKTGKSNEKGGTNFTIPHMQWLGLKVEWRDAKSSAIQPVCCRFCFRIGREA
jgi:hypothetical protein